MIWDLGTNMLIKAAKVQWTEWRQNVTLQDLKGFDRIEGRTASSSNEPKNTHENIPTLIVLNR